MPQFKGFKKIDQLKDVYTFARNIESKNPIEKHELCHHNEHKKLYLIRTISKDKAASFSPDMIKQIVAQIRVMQNGDVGISHVYEVLETPTTYHIVQDYEEGGDLENKRIDYGGIFEEFRCAQIIEQLLQVLDHLHENQIIHRDIRPANILFSSTNITDFTIKVQGFERATSFTNNTIKTNKSDIEYDPPEILKGEKGDSKVDIWALGVLAYTIIDSMSPFWDESDEKIK